MSKARVLVVEDEVLIGMEIEQSLRSLGYDVISLVDTGDEAIRKTEETRPDLILMDIRIKGDKDGIDTAEIIKNRFGTPVVFSTAYLDQERIERAKITMPFGYVLKPIQEREFKVTLEMALYVSKVDAKRKKAEEKLAESEERYRGIVEDTPVLICQFLPQGEITFVNQEFCKYYQKTQEELVGTGFLSLIQEEDRKAVWDTILSLNNENSTKTHNNQVVLPNGNIAWQRWINRAIFSSEDNKIISYQSIGEDITKQKLAEDEIYKQKTMLENAETLLNLGSWDWDIVNDNFTVSQQWLRIHGWNKPTLTTEELMPIAHPDDRDIINKTFQEAVENFKSYDLEHRIIRMDDGVERIVKAYGKVLKGNNGKAIRLYGAVHDVTESRNAELKLQRSEQLLREVVNSMEKAIAIFEPINNGEDFKFLDTNEFADITMQYKTEEVVGGTIKELFPGESTDGLIEKMKETYLSGKSTSIQLKQNKDKQTVQWVDSHIFKLPSGKVVAMFEDTREKRKHQ